MIGGPLADLARKSPRLQVTFDEAATVFSDPRAPVIEDESHPETARTIGESLAGRILLVVFIEPHRDVVRLISAARHAA